MQVAKGDQNVYPMPGGLAGSACPGGYKYGWLAFQVGGGVTVRQPLTAKKSELLGNIICDLGTARLRGIDLRRGQEYGISNEDSNLESGIV